MGLEHDEEYRREAKIAIDFARIVRNYIYDNAIRPDFAMGALNNVSAEIAYLCHLSKDGFIRLTGFAYDALVAAKTNDEEFFKKYLGVDDQ